MTIYSQAFRTSNVTVNQACLQILASSTNRVSVLEIGFITSVATAQTIGLGRPAANAGTPTNTLFVTEESGAPASQTNGAITWVSSPTAPSVFMARASMSNVIGHGFIWTFPRPGIIIPVSGAVVLWNITTTVASDVWVVIDEQGS